jgi:hypothetical protein
MKICLNAVPDRSRLSSYVRNKNIFTMQQKRANKPRAGRQKHYKIYLLFLRSA